MDAGYSPCERHVLKLLAESVFAAVYCDAQDAEGIYNDDLLEPPTADDVAAEAKPLNGLRLERAAQLPIGEGIGAALTNARNQPAVRHFITSNAATLEQHEVNTALDHYVDCFLKEYSRRPRGARSTAAGVGILIDHVLPCVGGLVAFLEVVSGLQLGTQGRIVELLGLAKPLTRLGPPIAQAWGLRELRRTLGPELKEAMAQRCHRVPLLSSRHKKPPAAANEEGGNDTP
jgi:hypothetical protein